MYGASSNYYYDMQQMLWKLISNFLLWDKILDKIEQGKEKKRWIEKCYHSKLGQKNAVVKCRFVVSPMKTSVDCQGVIETWKVLEQTNVAFLFLFHEMQFTIIYEAIQFPHTLAYFFLIKGFISNQTVVHSLWESEI